MNELYHHISETASTNVLMKELLRKNELPEGFVVHADFQHQGKGQGRLGRQDGRLVFVRQPADPASE